MLPTVVCAQFQFTTNNDGSLNIYKYTGSGGVVTIPSTTNGLTVTSIGNSAFQFASLTSITIPNSVISLGNYAFYGCGNLTNATIGNSVTNIGISAFRRCNNLANVTIGNNVTSIGNYAFSYCYSLTSISIPDSVTNIGYQAFYDCISLISVTIPSKVTSIGDGAFEELPFLTSFYIKGNTPSLGGLDVFDGDSKLTVYHLPGTTGWGKTFGGRPTELWNPQAQTSSASFGVRTNRFGFNIIGSSNLVIVVEASTDLANPVWSVVGTNTLKTFIGTNGTSYFSDSHWTNYPDRYYRLRSP